jgi:hypothetical protein
VAFGLGVTPPLAYRQLVAKRQLARLLGTPLSPRAGQVLAVAGVMILALEFGLVFRAWGLVRSLGRDVEAVERQDAVATAFLSSVRRLAIAMGPNVSSVHFESAQERRAYREFLASTGGPLAAFPEGSRSPEEVQAYVSDLLERLHNAPIWRLDPEDKWKPDVRIVPFSDAAKISDGLGVVLVLVTRVSSVYLDGTALKTAFEKESFGTMATTDLAPGFHEMRVETREGDVRLMKFPVLERAMTIVQLEPPPH